MKSGAPSERVVRYATQQLRHVEGLIHPLTQAPTSETLRRHRRGSAHLGRNPGAIDPSSQKVDGHRALVWFLARVRIAMLVTDDGGNKIWRVTYFGERSGDAGQRTFNWIMETSDITFDQSQAGKDFVMNFFWAFTRAEYALKHADYVDGDEKGAKASWDRYASDNAMKFNKDASDALSLKDKQLALEEYEIVKRYDPERANKLLNLILGK